MKETLLIILVSNKTFSYQFPLHRIQAASQISRPYVIQISLTHLVDIKCEAASIAYGPKWHELQVYGPRNELSEFVDLTDTNYKFMDPEI